MTPKETGSIQEEVVIEEEATEDKLVVGIPQTEAHTAGLSQTDTTNMLNDLLTRRITKPKILTKSINETAVAHLPTKVPPNPQATVEAWAQNQARTHTKQIEKRVDNTV